MLTTDANKAKWANEGLPTDPLSIENGAIMTNASRWALMIDPQLQGIKWIINREEPMGLVIIQQSQHKYIDKVRGYTSAYSSSLHVRPSFSSFQLIPDMQTTCSLSLQRVHLSFVIFSINLPHWPILHCSAATALFR